MHRFSIRTTLVASILVAGAWLPAPSSRAGEEPPAAPPAAARLAIGAPAPPLRAVTWLKGEPVKEWAKGQVYVLDFWATWCGPCVASIPHINQLQAKYKDKGVNVIGVAIWPRGGQKPTDGFVKAKGDAMSYRIAEDINGQTAKAFMDSMGQGGIPTCMVIDKEGRLAWVGHPMNGLNTVVEQVVDGTFDIGKARRSDAEAAEKRDRAAEAAEKGQALVTRWQSQLAAQNWEEAAKVADELVALDASGYGQAALYKYYILLTKLGDKERAAAYGRELVAGPFAPISHALNSLAWLIVNETSIEDASRDLDLAQAALDKADSIPGADTLSLMDSRARLQFRRGRFEDAVAMQTRALAAADNPDIRAQLEARLQEYKSAAGPKELAEKPAPKPAEAKP